MTTERTIDGIEALPDRAVAPDRLSPGLSDLPGSAALLRAVLDIGADLDLDATLVRIVTAATSLVGATYGALGVIDRAGTGLEQFVTIGLDDVTERAIGLGPAGLGLLGVLIADARPLRLTDLSGHPASTGFPGAHPPMHSFLGVPVRVRGKVFGSLYLTDKVGAPAFSAADEELTVGLATAAGVAIDHARLFGETEQHRRVLAAVHEVATVFVTGTDPHEMLQVVAGHARSLIAADLATIALPVDDKTMVIEVADGHDGVDVVGRHYARVGSISGDVMASGRTVVVNDVSSDHRRLQPQVDLGRVGPSAFVALRINHRTFGTLAVSRDRGGTIFTKPELALMETFAAHASVILERDQDRRTRARLHVLEDQERIARNLHDTVIQRLFAAGLTLQVASRKPEAVARQRMTDVVEELDGVINTIRTVIFDVHAEKSQGVRQQVLDLARELAPVLDLDPAVEFSGPVDTMVSPAMADEMLTTLREALSNVARHAHASYVTINVQADADQLTLLVTDDGIGRSAPAPAGHVGQGLRNMEARATHLGGQLHLDHPLAGGTTITWQVPDS